MRSAADAEAIAEALCKEAKAQMTAWGPDGWALLGMGETIYVQVLEIHHAPTDTWHGLFLVGSGAFGDALDTAQEKAPFRPDGSRMDLVKGYMLVGPIAAGLSREECLEGFSKAFPADGSLHFKATDLTLDGQGWFILIAGWLPSHHVLKPVGGPPSLNESKARTVEALLQR